MTDNPRQLLRTTDDKMIAGVCSGLARYLNVDVTIVRIAMVALALFGGGGFLLYAAMWLLMPREDSGARSPQDTAREAVNEMKSGVEDLADTIKGASHKDE